MSISRYATSALKRVTERILAAIFLVAFSPLLLVCAVAVVLFEGRPVLYASTRVGRHARRFRLWKFRTMRNAPGRPVTAGDDPRITRIGAYLRRTKLDELPQLWNVVCGEMSLTGPRPEVPEFVDITSEDWAEILKVAPGITGASSLEFFNEEERLTGSSDPIALYRGRILPQKLAIERRYLSRCSPLNDGRLLALTAARVFGRRKGEI